MLEEPIAVKLVGRADAEVITLDSDEPARTEPRIHYSGREVPTGGVEDARPKTL